MNTATATPSVIGHFDAIHEEIAYGWAYAPQQPGQRLAIELLDEHQELVGYGIAEHHREDLASEGIGDGHHQFKLALAYRLYDGEEHTITAYESQSGQPLPGSHAFGPVTRRFAYDLMPHSEGLDWLVAQLRHHASLTRSRAEALLKAYQLTSALHETGHYEEAHNAWKALGEATQLPALGHCKQAELQLLQNNPDAALTSYQQAIALAPNGLWPHLGFANALQQLGRFEEAERAAQQALALQPHHELAKARLHTLESLSLPERVAALTQTGDTQAAIHWLTERLLTKPDDTATFQALADLIAPADPEQEELPGMEALHAFQQEERVLNTLLNHLEQDSQPPRTQEAKRS
ncbi:MAG: tetratricopeptide repeat protein [Gammaproteobacteria bacterium]|nr:tetratricopeptide repeat protein [Gammaproteobacteria bacterium]